MNNLITSEMIGIFIPGISRFEYNRKQREDLKAEVESKLQLVIRSICTKRCNIRHFNYFSTFLLLVVMLKMYFLQAITEVLTTSSWIFL